MNTSTLTRRHALQLLGITAAGAAIPLGCSRSDEASDAGGGQFHGATSFDVPPKATFNFLGGIENQIDMVYFNDLFLMPGAYYFWNAQEFFYLLADESSELSADGKTFTYVVRDGLTWSDGAKITAKDVYHTWTLRWANNHAVFGFVKDFEQTDDMTVTFNIPTPSPVTQYYLLRERIVADATYGKWATKVDPIRKKGAAYDDESVVSIVQEINKFQPDKAIVSGPFNFDYDSVSNAELTLVKNDKGYLVDKVNFDSIRIYRGETPTVTPLLLDKSVDYATHGLPVATEERLVSMGYRIARPPVYSGPALYFNFDRLPEFKDKRVRQALGYAINRDQNGNVSLGESGKGIELMAGISDTMVDTWVPAAEQKKFIRYDHDLDKATQLLTDAGWTKKGDTWRKPDGSEAAYDLLFTSDYADWSSSAQDAAGQLNDFGIKITRRGEEHTLKDERTYEGDFELTIGPWGSSSNPFPSDAFRPPLYDNNIPGLASGNQRGIGFDMVQQTDVVGEIDLEQAIVDAGLGATTDDLKANVAKLALAFNELMPVVPLFERLGNNPINEDEVAGYPAEGNPIYLNSPYADNFTTILMYQGALKPA